VVVCKIAHAALLVSGLLAGSILIGLVRMSFAVLLPVVRILCPPLLRAVIANLAVDRARGDLAAMILSPYPLLAFRRLADRLLRMVSGRIEGTLAEPARRLKHPSRVTGIYFQQKIR
jgi:hypothetical protein